MGCENKEAKWFSVRVGTADFDVAADCEPCAVDNLSRYLAYPVDWPVGTTAMRGAFMGVPSPDDPNCSVAVQPITDRPLDDLKKIAPTLGEQTVLFRGV